VQFGVVNEVVIVELSRNPSVLPTPKNSRSVVPLSNSVSGEHSSPIVVFTTNVDEPVLVITFVAKGKKYIFGFDGFNGLLAVPETNPQAIKCPDVDPLTQKVLSNVPE